MSHKQTLKYFSPVCSSVQQERSDSAEPSSVSVKSHWSIDPPPQMTERRDSLSLALQERSDSPEPSHVSMKSDWSIDPPPQMKEENRSLVQQERSPKSSCVSMKRDWSIDPPPQMNDEDGQKRLSLVQQERSDSAEPSLVSMKSDWSIDPPPQMKDGDRQKSLSLVQQERSDSPEPSHVTMKSNWSIDPPPQMTDRRDSLRQIPRPRPGAEEPISKKMKYDESVIKSQECMENPSLIFSHEVNTFRVNLLKKFQCLYEGMVTQDNPALLNEIYTELYITESESGEISNEHEVRQIETQSRRSTTEDTAIKCRDIFTPLPGQDKAIRTVLTKGVAGIGKTVSVQKFILDWAEEKENQDVQLIFPLPFREINLMKDKTLSLSDLLQLFFPETKEIDIFSDKYKILFIFDGLDECRLLLNFKSNEILQHVTKTSSVDVLLTNLIVGNLLPSALIWITSRPAAADLVPSECVHRVTEVRGFNDPQKEEYFSKRISDQSLANTIISHLKSSRSLYIMCHIPVFCWISATVLEKMLSEAETAEIPKTLTQMYTHFLMAQINTKDMKYTGKKDKDMIFKLGKLAYEQLERGNVIFYEEDLRECGIDVAEASVYSGLCTQIFREEFGLYQGKVFSFIHLSVQEHLAALYVHLLFTNHNRNVFEQMTKKTSKTLDILDCFHSNSPENVLLSELHQKAVDEALQSKNGHLDLFLRFLLGLSLESNQILLQELMIKFRSSSDSSEKTVEYIKKRINNICLPEKSINLFYCLNELGDHSLVKEIQQYMDYGTLAETKISCGQWSALVFILLTVEQAMDVFELNKFIGLKKSSDEVLRKLLPVIKKSRSAIMDDCNITAEGCAYLASALGSNPSYLRELDLSANKLQDSGIKKLSKGLQDSHCKLEKLNLYHCGVTNEGCAALASALKSNPEHLRDLNLSENKIGNLGLTCLSEILKNSLCKLEILRLCQCGITDCTDLASALISNPEHLRELELSLNKIGDSGVTALCAAFEDPRFKLEKLGLSGCGLTDEGCAALTSALRSNHEHLRDLDLSGNKVDKEVKGSILQRILEKLNNIQILSV
ncbi:NACHT, LRR and PYD domains-containing protein 3 isoform X1 [Danio rerio]|uniref:NACHT, LRR and PYD domains-containing protein 3 isoform X1 n=3 Tax=Danio rerio TaxID=7955 RepID=A0A8M6YSM0_DANRE|nr:NACHT, LRR and PYD domains-containing protein 3-like isoform X2 [Danio rerio]|eukprot:XP_017206753.1 NACHT, LRR and PYD domains-containing protein 3-like isoform X2 [Danio rerio]